MVIFLAIVQGITEWLPISSSGHLVIAQEWLGLELPLFFNVMLHVGTLCVIVVVFRQDLSKMIMAIVKLDSKTEEGKMAVFIAIGSVPTALIGLLFYDVLESLFYNVFAVGIALLITGFFLSISERREGKRKLNYVDSILTGIAQGIAIIPGISRSGLTIATGLLRKVEKETAFKFSFLLSVPAIIGATIVESRELVIGSVDLAAMSFGVVTTFIVGYASLKALEKIVMKEKFHLFAYYCWIVGGLIVFSRFVQ